MARTHPVMWRSLRHRNRRCKTFKRMSKISFKREGGPLAAAVSAAGAWAVAGLEVATSARCHVLWR